MDSSTTATGMSCVISVGEALHTAEVLVSTGYFPGRTRIPATATAMTDKTLKNHTFILAPVSSPRKK